MFPYKDDNPTETVPFVTIAFIVINIAVFLYQLIGDQGVIVASYGAIPAALVPFGELGPMQPLPPAATLLTSMFMHGGFLHLGGNMLYLWIFGNNIEDELGHVGFVVFYVLCGVVAAYAHALSSPNSLVPMIGASGAIAGVLGAYLWLYPRAQVHTLLFLGFFVQVIKLPALIVIGFWAIIQAINSISALGGSSGGGVAWFAHLGGFAFGLAAIYILRPKRRSARSGYRLP